MSFAASRVRSLHKAESGHDMLRALGGAGRLFRSVLGPSREGSSITSSGTYKSQASVAPLRRTSAHGPLSVGKGTIYTCTGERGREGGGSCSG